MLFSLLTWWEFRKQLVAAQRSQAEIGLTFVDDDGLVNVVIENVGWLTLTYHSRSMEDGAWLATNTVSQLDIAGINHAHITRDRNRLMHLECDGTLQFEGEAGACHENGECNCGLGDEEYDHEDC